MLRKITFLFLTFLILAFGLASPFAASVSAQTGGNQPQPGSGAPQEGTWFNQSFVQWADKVYNPDNPDEIFGERYTAAQVSWIMFSVISFLLNNFGDAEVNWCVARKTVENSGGDLMPNFGDISAFFDNFGCAAYYEGPVGAIVRAVQFLTGSGYISSEPSLANSFYTVRYLKRSLIKIHIVPEVYAQGFGYNAVDLIQGLWTVVRNVAYAFLVLYTIVLAFMVMFRAKISPQTVVTVQSAIPKVIVALVLVTFSYAIAGFLIDLMYVSLGLIVTILTSPQAGILENTNWTVLWSKFTETGIFSWFFAYFGAFWYSLTNYVGLLLMFFDQMSTQAITGQAITNPDETAYFFLSFLLVILVEVLVGIVLIVICFKFILFLIKNYLNIILQIAFSPILILGGVSGGGAGNWIRNMLGLLAVYPVTALLLVAAFLFLEPAVPQSLLDIFRPVTFDFRSGLFGTGAEWDPPFGWGSTFGPLVFMIASLAVISLIPKVGEIVKSMVSGKPITAGSAIGEAWGSAVATAGVASAWRDRGVQQKIAREERLGKDPKNPNQAKDALSAQNRSFARQNWQVGVESLKNIWNGKSGR